jgi:large subunit ribosomal protein L15
MIRLEDLPGDPGMFQKRKRVGRGEGSGLGRTSGRGNKGAGSRTGTVHSQNFEGGQTPLARRLPKRGFSHAAWDVPTEAVTLRLLNRFEDGAVVDFAALVGAGLVKRSTQRVKVIATGTLSKKLTIRASGFSAGAKTQIEAAGGVCEVVEGKINASPKDETEA